jgi:imidazolonepropionase-like amidohydrolase
VEIVNANLIDGTAGAARHGVTIALEGDRIVGIAGSVPAATGDVIDAGGRWVVPGLINAHEHLTMKGLLLERGQRSQYYDIYRNPAETQLLQCAGSALVSIGRGITTVRDAGAAWFASLHARNAIRHGTIPGPRVFTCGQVLSIPFEGEGVKEAGMTTDAAGEEGIQQRVDELAGMGVDFIKLKGHRRDFSSLERTRLYSAEEIVAAGRAAHRHGLKFALHAWHNDVVEVGLRAKVADSIEHGNPLHERPDLVERMASDGVTYVPNVLSWAPSPDRDPRYQSMSGIALERIWDSTRMAIAKGVAVAAGTDLHTDHLHSELEVYVSLGLPRERALECVTVNGARLLGMEDRLGSVEPGKLADLSILDGDPREDLSLLARPWLVVLAGRSYDAAAIRALVGDE